MRELVMVGTVGEVETWRQNWIERGKMILDSVGLHTDAVPASDPFFGRTRRMLSTNQRKQGLKLEGVHPIATENPTAIMSVNYHQDHFGVEFGIHTVDG